MTPNAIIYDIEIVNAVPTRGQPATPGVNYCEGWHDHKNMGVSVIGVYDYVTDSCRVFCDDNQDDFFDLCDRADFLVGFNNITFDNAVIDAAWGAGKTPMPESKCYDLLREAWAANGMSQKFNPKTHGGYGLDAMCKANFGSEKTGNGALAPALWQQGKVGAVIDYCLNDVRLTKQLFDLALSGGSVVNPRDGGVFKFRSPFPIAPR